MKIEGPDSIQSWKVMTACFVIKFLFCGLIETAGMLMVASVSTFDITREEASLPFTLVYSLRNAIGPLVGYIGYKIGSRFSVLIGCIVSAFAVGGCFFANTILTVTILWGIIFGIGLAFGTLFLNAIIIEHFEKHLGKATGISGTGVQLGTIFYSLLLELVFNSYGLLGSFLILSGITLNCIPAALVILYNKPEQYKTAESFIKQTYVCNPENVNSKLNTNILFYNKGTQKEIKTITEKIIFQGTKHKFQTECSKQNEEICGHSEIHTNSFRKNYDQPTIFDNSVLETQSYNSDRCDILKKFTKREMKAVLHSNEDAYHKMETQIGKDNDVISFDRSLNKMEPTLRSKHFTLEQNHSKVTKQKHVLIELFKNPIFLLILGSSGMYYFSSLTFLTILVDYAVDIGIPMTYTKYILIWYSISELIGGVFLGYITDNRLMTYNGFASLCFACASMTMIGIIYAKHYIAFPAIITVHQLGVAGLTLNYSSIVSEFIEKDLISPAMASLFVLAAPLSLSVLPLIGYFRDKQGSYAGVFYTIAASELLGCLLHFVIPVVDKKRKHKKFKRSKLNLTCM